MFAIREGIYILLKTINLTFVKLHTYTKQPIIINISLFYHDLITMRGAMPTHLGANPRNHVKHDSCSSLENFYYYILFIYTTKVNSISLIASIFVRSNNNNEGNIYIIRRYILYYYIYIIIFFTYD